MHIKIVLIGIILESIENHLSVALIIWYADRRLSWPPSPLVQLANFEIEPRMAAPLTSPSSSTPLINQTSLYYSFLCPHISLHSPFEPPQISADSDLPACTLPDLFSSIPPLSPFCPHSSRFFLLSFWNLVRAWGSYHGHQMPRSCLVSLPRMHIMLSHAGTYQYE